MCVSFIPHSTSPLKPVQVTKHGALWHANGSHCLIKTNMNMSETFYFELIPEQSGQHDQWRLHDEQEKLESTTG